MNHPSSTDVRGDQWMMKVKSDEMIIEGRVGGDDDVGHVYSKPAT
jgi:hypothetical protein